MSKIENMGMNKLKLQKHARESYSVIERCDSMLKLFFSSTDRIFLNQIPPSETTWKEFSYASSRAVIINTLVWGKGYKEDTVLIKSWKKQNVFPP